MTKSKFLPPGQYWYPALGISWYTIAPDLASEAVIEYDKFGMGPNAEVWEQYLISFYWVTTTLTVNGYVLYFLSRIVQINNSLALISLVVTDLLET